jgi:hypothetical protein
MKKQLPPGLTKANNSPVGSAGQPSGGDAKMNAISRRIAARRKKDSGAKN